jgi:hypothetical protein
VVPKGAVSVTATVKAVLGTTPTGTGAAAVANTVVGAPNVYLALFSAPQTSGGADGAEVAGTRATVTGLANTGASLTTAIPSTSSTAPIPYIVRLWVDGLTGTNGVQVTDMVMA